MILPRLFRTYLWMMAEAMVAGDSPQQGGPTSGEATRGGLAAVRRDAFTEMYDTCMPGVYRYVNYRVGNASLAEDLTADVFEKALRHFDSYDRAKAAPSTWLMTIARNTITDHFRKESRVQVVREEDAPDQVSEEPETVDEIAKIEEVRQLRLCLSELPQMDQDIISLKFGAGMNNREIARTLKLSESNVGTRLYRAVRRLRESFKGWEDNGSAK